MEKVAFRTLMEVWNAICKPWTAKVKGAVALAAGVVNEGAKQGAKGANRHYHGCCAVSPLQLLEVVV